jgi:hypothetical protein
MRRDEEPKTEAKDLAAEGFQADSNAIFMEFRGPKTLNDRH